MDRLPYTQDTQYVFNDSTDLNNVQAGIGMLARQHVEMMRSASWTGRIRVRVITEPIVEGKD
jgi:hypothetical protein